MSSSLDITSDLGQRLRRVRQAASLTQEEAAAELGISTRSYQDYEAGNAWPRPKRRRQLFAWLLEYESQEAVA